MTIQTFELPNGMQVLIEENHVAKVVSFNALVKVGSANETDDEAGICHVIEHMLFKGTPTRPMGTIARDVEAAGGEINAYTSIDQTVFYINMASRFVDKGLSILADALQNPLFDEVELDREKEVILEEVRREQDNPSRMLADGLFQTAFQKHTYGRPIIGFPKTIKSFTRAQILEFYRRWYTPANISLVVVGDFETKAMLESLRREFAKFEGPPAPHVPPHDEPMQTKPRIALKSMNVQSVYLALAFHVPRITHADVPALDILAHIMGGADSSRLEQEIKERQKLVHNIYAYALTPKDPGLLVIGATLDGGAVGKAIAAIQREVERMKAEPVTTEELTTAKINIRSNEIYDKETVGGEGSKIASFIATAGSHEFENRYYQMIADVGAEKVREAAASYIDWKACTVALIVPDGSPLAAKKDDILNAVAGAKTHARVNAAARIGKPDKLKLKCGATLIVRENHNLPIVTVCAASLGGTRFETRATNGVSGLLARTLTKGTKTRSAVAIAREIEKIAGSIDGFSGRNAVGVRCEFLSEHLRDGFALFADVLTHPAFEPTEVAREKRLVIKSIRDMEDNLPSVAFSAFLEKLYPRHPYGLRQSGRIESVKKLTDLKLRRYHRDVMKASNTVLAVSGDVNREEVEELANELLADLPRGRVARPGIAIDPRPRTSQEQTILKRRKQQAHIVLGFQGTTYKDRDRYPMIVLNNILSGQGGRLFLELRDRMSLAYAVNSINSEGIEPGYFAVYIGTEPGKTRTAIDAIVRELKKIREKPVSEEEFERSKQYLVGTYELDLQRNGSIAAMYAFNELYDLGLAEIERYPQRILAVTREDVLRAAKKYITPESYTLAVVKPA